MTHLAIRILFCAGVMFAALLVGSAGAADPPKAPDEKKDNPEKPSDADEEHRRAAEKVVDAIDLEVLVAEKWVKVKRIDKPLLYYGDPTRENDRGSVWGWGEKGRPVALIELFQNTNDRKRWAYAICNTSGGKLRAKRAGADWWRENESSSELKDIPGAPAPAAEAPQRQRQLKQLAGSSPDTSSGTRTTRGSNSADSNDPSTPTATRKTECWKVRCTRLPTGPTPSSCSSSKPA